MDGLLAVIWLVGSAASIFFILRPKPDFAPYANRKRSAGMLAAFFLGVPIVGGMTGVLASKPEKPTGNAPKPATAASSLANTPPPTSAWLVSEETSPLDDSRNVYAAVDADNKIKGWLTSERPTLNVRCKEGKLDAYLDTKSQITADFDLNSGDRVAAIKYRVGNGAHTSARAPLSSDGQAIFFRRPETLIRNLKAADKFVIEYTPFQSGLGVATFATNGSTAPLSKILAACHRG